MLFRWRSNKQPEMKTVELPGEVGTVSMPANWVCNLEEDTTLLIYDQDCADVTIRISSISFSKPNADDNAAKEFVRTQAVERGHAFTDLGEKGVATYSEDVIEGEEALTICYWHIGSKNTLAILSATLNKSMKNSRAVKAMLQQIPSMVESLHISKSHFILEQDGRKVTGTTESVDPTPQEVAPFGEKENRWLATNLDLAHGLSLKYGSGGGIDPQELDRLYGRWAEETEGKESTEQIINALGAAFGEYLVESHGFCWVVLTDEYGTDYCVSHPSAQTKAFPCSSVEKRVATGAREFFCDLEIMIVDTLRQSAADSADN